MLIAGAGGFAKELIDTVLEQEDEDGIVFYDDVDVGENQLFLERFQIIRTQSEATAYFRSADRRFVIAVGDPLSRAELQSRMIECEGEPVTIISARAKVGRFKNFIGAGSILLPDVIMETDNSIGEGVLVHVGAFISHDVKIGNFCEVSPRANLLGSVRVGEKCRLGTACTILPGITIGDGAVVGAGAVVTKDVAENAKVAGVPAQPI